MIYLIKSSGYKELSDGSIESFFLLKIGYTEDSNKILDFLNIECIILLVGYYMRFQD